MTRSRNVAIIAAGAVLAATGATIASAQLGAPSTEPPTEKPVAVSAAPQASARYGVLNQARKAADVSPLRAGSFAVKQHGINVNLSRRIGPASAKVPTFVVPATEGLCLFASLPGSAGPGGGCSSVKDFEAGYATTSFPQDSGVTYVVGIVPDGVKAVTLLNVDGTTKQIEAVSNGFEATVGPEARSVSWVDPATGATITAPVTTST